MKKAKLIYNPHAGKKRNILSLTTGITLEDIKNLLNQYQIPIHAVATKKPDDGRKFAEQSKKEGYSLVIVAGGDGTIAEVASGLIGTDIPLAILPLGTFMNLARMLAIPQDIEKAIALIKIGRSRKIDAGKITMLKEETLAKPQYFFEEAGIGIEAELHALLTGIFERGEYLNIVRLPQVFFQHFGKRIKLNLDGEVIETRTTLVTISNGPYSGAAIPYAPKAKLNDHFLTVNIYKMTLWELIKHFFTLIVFKKAYSRKRKTYLVKRITIQTYVPRLIHADARVFGTTPVQFEVIPNAVTVITGFAPAGKSALRKRTYLDP